MLFEDLKKAFLLFLVGILLRLIILPFSSVNDADAVSRIFLAINWLENPILLSSGVWLPLNLYFNAFVIYLFGDHITAPIILNIVIASATAIPLYFFTKNEFSSKTAWFVACAYSFSPMVIRYSLMPLSDVQFAFFVALAILFISKWRKIEKKWIYAASAGLMITISSLLRYEGWLLIPLLGILFWKKPKHIVIFLLFASICPVFWMSGNYLHYGDPFYGTNEAAHWEKSVEGRNENLDFKEITFRTVYFPEVLFLSVTPIMALISLLGVIMALYKRAYQTVWLIPLCGLFVILLFKTIDGSISWRPRYTITMGMLFIPFSAYLLSNIRKKAFACFVMMLTLSSMIPLSYISSVTSDDINKYIPKEIKAVPALRKKIHQSSLSINKMISNTGGGLICDNIDKQWGDTCNLALMSGLHPRHIFIMPGGKHEKLIMDDLNRFLHANSNGIIVLDRNSQFSKTACLEKDTLSVPGLPQKIYLEQRVEIDNITIFKYRY